MIEVAGGHKRGESSSRSVGSPHSGEPDSTKSIRKEGENDEHEGTEFPHYSQQYRPRLPPGSWRLPNANPLPASHQVEEWLRPVQSSLRSRAAVLGRARTRGPLLSPRPKQAARPRLERRP